MKGDNTRALEAERLLSERDRRYDLFPSEIFDEFAWNMLLHLFVALAKNETMSEVRLCELSHAGKAAGRRWIAHLVKDKQIEARSDGDDVVLTGEAVDRLRRYLSKPSIAEIDVGDEAA